MASIGGYTVMQMTGEIQPSGYIIEHKTRPGVAGVEAMVVGYWGKPFTIETMTAFASANLLSVARLLYNALRGSNVTVVDSLGTTWYNILVDDMEVLDARAHGGGVGNMASTSHYMRVRWTLRSAATSY